MSVDPRGMIGVQQWADFATLPLNALQPVFPDQGTLNALNVQSRFSQPTAYTDGIIVTLRIANTVTATAPTLSINNLPALPIQNRDGSVIGTNQLLAGSAYTFVYSASLNSWVLIAGGGPVTVTGVVPRQLDISSDWQGWAFDLVQDQNLQNVAVADPRGFSDWQEWAARFNQVVPY